MAVISLTIFFIVLTTSVLTNCAFRKCETQFGCRNKNDRCPYVRSYEGGDYYKLTTCHRGAGGCICFDQSGKSAPPRAMKGSIFNRTICNKTPDAKCVGACSTIMSPLIDPRSNKAYSCEGDDLCWCQFKESGKRTSCRASGYNQPDCGGKNGVCLDDGTMCLGGSCTCAGFLSTAICKSDDYCQLACNGIHDYQFGYACSVQDKITCFCTHTRI